MIHKVSTQRLVPLLVLTACLGATLSACVPLVPLMVGGTFVGGAMVATDRRTSGTQLEDEGIELRSGARLRDNLGDRIHVNITSYNRQVLLTGEVPSAQDKQLVEQVVSKVDNVRSIVNEVSVTGHSTLGQRTSDSMVTGRVKAGFVDAKDLFANAFKVVTERGTTYLMGRVTPREANRAADVARNVDGVHKVVRVLDIISEDELANQQLPQPAPVDYTK